MPYDRSIYCHVKTKGHGSFCIVQEIVRLSDRKHFAYKELRHEHKDNSDYQNRLRREIGFISELDGCKNVIDIIEFSNSPDTDDIWYIMPLADTNLHNYIKNNNCNLSKEERFAIISQVLNSIVYAHGKNIVHRDIYPKNVLVFTQPDKSLQFVMSDFGLGKDSSSYSLYTNSGISGYGAAYYVSPEQKENLKVATTKSDIYSLGKLMHFVMTGKDPTDKFDCDISHIILRCTEEDPDKRYPDIANLVSDFTILVNAFEANEFPIDSTTLADYLRNVNELFSWEIFHAIAKKGLHYDHPFRDYIEPVVEYMGNEKILKHYVNHINGDFKNFLDTFMSVLDQLIGRTGWPFSYSNNIGKFLFLVYSKVSDHNVKINCLNRLWLIGFIGDQYSVQDDLLTILKSDIPEDLILPFIQTIKGRSRKLNIAKITSSGIRQLTIKQAMLQCHKQWEEMEKEESKLHGSRRFI